MERLGPQQLEVGKRITTESGTKVYARFVPLNRIKGDATAHHEGAHTEAAYMEGIDIEEATNIPTTEYRGATKTRRKGTPFIFMAAKGLGYGGTGHDEAVTKYGLGADPDAAASDAAHRLAGREDYIDAIASKIQQFGTIGQQEVDDAHKEVDEERAGIHKVRLEVLKPNGKQEVREVKSLHNRVMVPGELCDIQEDLEQAA